MRITKQEIESYFSQSFGYETADTAYLLRIYCPSKKDIIYLKSQPSYSRFYLFISLWLDRKTLAMPFRVEWYRFLWYTHLNRQISKSK